MDRKLARRKKARELARDFLWIIVGTAVMAVSTNIFYSPANMVPGGFTGLALIIRHLTVRLYPGGFPLWASTIALNLPLILFSILLRGWKFLWRTLAATLLFSAHLYWIPEYALVPDDLFLTALCGGTLMGLGLGMVLVGKATTGGTDTLAALIQKLIPYVGVSKIVPVLDGAIILLSIFIFGIPVTLYAMFSVYLTGIFADKIPSGMKNARMFYIISGRYRQIADAILREMDRGVTLLPGTGMYTETDRPVLLCAVSRKQVVAVRQIVADVDPNAFMILTDASEVRGEGFLTSALQDEL